jgi:hypothetical protein
MKTNKKNFKRYLQIGVLVLGAVILIREEEGGIFSWGSNGSTVPSAGKSAGHERYQCPMHPQIIQDHPGECPICHMRLEKVEDDDSTGGTAAGAGQSKIVRYRNPMDPTIFSDHPMKDSMGMDYIPVTDEAKSQDEAGGVTGKAGFTLSPERQQLIGVRTTMAEIKPLTLTVRMPGRVSSGGQILAQLLEIDAGGVRRGMKARLQGPGGAEIGAVVVDVDGNLDSLTRSFGVVLQPSSAAPWFNPGVFCQVLVDANLGKHLSVPDEAILDTGERQVLFVESDKGHFEPRQVILGQAGDDWVEVKQGVKAGEQVVTSANFLIDSESRFQAALKQF